MCFLQRLSETQLHLGVIPSFAQRKGSLVLREASTASTYELKVVAHAGTITDAAIAIRGSTGRSHSFIRSSKHRKILVQTTAGIEVDEYIAPVDLRARRASQFKQSESS